MQINQKTQTPPLRTHEGAVAHRITPLQQLRRSLMACMLWEDTFYEEGADIAARIASLTLAVDPAEAAVLAVEARTSFKLRHAPLLVARTLACGTPEQRAAVAKLLPQIILRADELAEFVSLYWATDKKGNKAPLSAQVKKGLARAFKTFDAYQLAKYNRDKDVTLRDVMFMVHPKPDNIEQAQNWKLLAADQLPIPNTWETRLSSGEDAQTVWTDLLLTQKLGGLALLRNLRNMQAAKVDDTLIRESILNGKFQRVLPFRFLSAAKHAPDFEPELEAAMFKSLTDVKLPGKTAILIDCSDSMRAAVSTKSTVSRMEAGAALGMILREMCTTVDVVAFGSSAVVLPSRRGFGLIDLVTRVNREPQWYVGHGTNIAEAKRLADSRGYDRIVIITDEQSATKPTAPQGKGYVINVAAYKNGIGYGPWTHMDGFSESTVNYIMELERAESR